MKLENYHRIIIFYLRVALRSRNSSKFYGNAYKFLASPLKSITAAFYNYSNTTIRWERSISHKRELTSSGRVQTASISSIGLKKKEYVDDLHSSIDNSSCSEKDRSKFESGPAIRTILFPPETG